MLIIPVHSPAPKLSGIYSGPCTGQQNVGLKQIDCQLFLQQKKKGGLFRISRELQLCVCNHGGPCASSYTGRERKPANTEKKEAGSIVVNPVHGFSLAESLSGNEGFFFFLLGSAMVKGHESSPFWSPNSI